MAKCNHVDAYPVEEGRFGGNYYWTWECPECGERARRTFTTAESRMLHAHGIPEFLRGELAFEDTQPITQADYDLATQGGLTDGR